MSKPRQQTIEVKKEWKLEPKVEFPLPSFRLSILLKLSELQFSQLENVGNLIPTFFFLLVKC